MSGQARGESHLPTYKCIAFVRKDLAHEAHEKLCGGQVPGFRIF